MDSFLLPAKEVARENKLNNAQSMFLSTSSQLKKEKNESNF